MNGSGAATAACCQYSAQNGGGIGGGISAPGASGRVSIPRDASGLLQRVGEALQNAIHGGDSGGGGSSAGRGASGGGGGARGLNPVPFPMVNPFKPIVKARSPVTGLTAFPDRFTYNVPAGDGEPDDEQGGFSGLGYSWADVNPGYPTEATFPSGGGSKLQTIVGGIAATLPATIQAFRASPSNIYPASGYGAYGSNSGGLYPNQQAGADIGASAGAAVGGVGDTIGTIIQRHPYLVLGGVAAAILLFMNPPRRR